jgi:hypothetical protein
MTATIVKKRKLRTGEGGYAASTANSSDPYLVRVSEQVDHIKVLELFAALPGTPVPKVTTKPFGDNYVVCDRITCANVQKQRYLWLVTVHWKELEDSKPEDRSQPMPNSGSTDPMQWQPTVTRRPAPVNEPMEDGYYEGGYSGQIDSDYTLRTTVGDRTPLTNSATVPFRDALPVRRRPRSIWTIKWIRPGSIAQTVKEFENVLNEDEVTFAWAGLTETWPEYSALIESVQLTPVKYGLATLWEITMEILYDPKTHLISILDKGTTELYRTGDALPIGGYATEETSAVIKDVAGRPTWEEYLLDGQGRRGSTDNPVFGLWRDQDAVEFTDIPLLSALVS